MSPPGPARVTSLDVARLAGVSQSALSRAFNPGRSVSPQTAAKVRAAAEALGYRPNAQARGMATGRSRLIGIVVAYLENQFYPVALERLSRQLQQRGYHALVYLSEGHEADADAVVRGMLDHQVDGILVASAAMPGALTDRLRAAGVPIVLFNRGQDGAALTQVTSDNEAGGRRAARALLAAGRRRLAHVAGWQETLTGRDRTRGFLSELDDAGLAPVAMEDARYDRGLAREAALAMFSGPDRPDGVFVGNDHMAFAVMDALRFELGLDVPGDVAVIGYDDVPEAAWPAYSLTTLRQPVNRMAAAAVGALLDAVEGGHSTPRRIAIESPLIARGSCPAPEGSTA
jgi:DNA-binding LacI/PurR family transcriptional regulator